MDGQTDRQTDDGTRAVAIGRLRLLLTFTVWTPEAAPFKSGVIRRETSVFGPRLSLFYGVTTTTTNELRSCYGCVKEVPRIIYGLLRLCYEFAKLCNDGK